MTDIIAQVKHDIEAINKALEDVKSTGEPEKDTNWLDYKSSRASYMQSTLNLAIKNLRSNIWGLAELRKAGSGNEALILRTFMLANKLEPKGKKAEISKQLEELYSYVSEIKSTGKGVAESFQIEIPILPEGIKSDVMADLNEIRKNFEAGCYRSCVVLCGRVLETALHRKYYEGTGADLMETNPGIGLGKIIAKLDEENVKFDPGLTQQIHLINQVRIFTVHSKREAFYPSKGQAQAMILYTIDVLKKLFG